MTPPPRIWTCAAFHGAFLCGGWASLRAGPGGLTGLAGGERRTTPGRMALAGLAAVLADLPPAAEVEIRTPNPELAGFAGLLASLGQVPPAGPTPDEDLDLWARIITAAAGRRLTLIPTALEPGGPLAFAAAWADLARDKAKASGPFAAAIPRANLAKANLAKVEGLIP